MYGKIAELQKLGITSVLVTVTHTKGSTPREVGAKMLVTPKEFIGSIGGGSLEYMALEKAREILNSDEKLKMAIPLCSKAHQCCGGFVELFFDVIHPQPQVFIFGAGHVSQAFLEVIAGTRFECTVIDERPAWIEEAEKKKAQFTNLSLRTVLENPLDWIENFQAINAHQTYALVMTHDHALDEAIVEKLAPRPLRYLGLIGSTTKRQRFFTRLQEKGLSKEDLNRISCPMGISIGGKAPKEVALSIGAELIQLLNA